MLNFGMSIQCMPIFLDSNCLVRSLIRILISLYYVLYEFFKEKRDLREELETHKIFCVSWVKDDRIHNNSFYYNFILETIESLIRGITNSELDWYWVGICRCCWYSVRKKVRNKMCPQSHNFITIFCCSGHTFVLSEKDGGSLLKSYITSYIIVGDDRYSVIPQ